uniref:Uncharacterized protein n=2 Tax=Astyanax mexicanus TaxID=7994 RepID=A0A3B1JNZ3_ASTMX
LFQKDNTRPHAAAISRACLKYTDAMAWPATSPDLSLIKDMCDAIRHVIKTLGLTSTAKSAETV